MKRRVRAGEARRAAARRRRTASRHTRPDAEEAKAEAWAFGATLRWSEAMREALADDSSVILGMRPSQREPALLAQFRAGSPLMAAVTLTGLAKFLCETAPRGCALPVHVEVRLSVGSGESDGR